MPAGQPTKYKPEYATKAFVDEFIEDCKQEKLLVSLCRLAVYVGVCEETIQEWKRKHPEFSVSLNRIKQVSKDMLMQLGLTNAYNSTIAKLILSANHGVRETQNQHITGELDQRIILGRKKK